MAYDGNGNVMGLVEATAGTVAAREDYGPFGEPLKLVPDKSHPCPFRFSTKYQDEETDLYYYGYRYYNPSTGRWASRDSIEEAGGLNLYGFVGNSPPGQTDVLGCWNWKVHFDRTEMWSRWKGFVPAFAWIIAFEDQRIDDNPQTWSGPGGQLGRHMLVWIGTRDSRDVYYDKEFDDAKKFLRLSKSDSSVTWCVRAAEAFGRGLHSRQDQSAHPVYPDKSSWPPLIEHPGWWDAWDDQDLEHKGGADEWWRKIINQAPTYYPWIRDDPAQREEQRAKIVRVTAESLSSIQTFKEKVEETCCRKIMLEAR